MFISLKQYNKVKKTFKFTGHAAGIKDPKDMEGVKEDISSPSPHLKHAGRFLEEVSLDGLHPPGRNLQPQLQSDDVKGDQAEQPCQSLLSCNVKIVIRS